MEVFKQYRKSLNPISFMKQKHHSHISGKFGKYLG